MNNPNPFVPQGSLLEQEKRRSRMKLAVFCVLTVSVCGLTAMLIQGCGHRENTDADNNPPVDTNTLATTDTNLPPMGGSNATAVIPPPSTNQVVVPPPMPEPATSEYTVAAGDTLGKIAKKNGVTVKAIEEANPGVVPTKLKVNQKLVIPAATGGTTASVATDMTATSGGGEEIYKVKSGDTLTKIAKANGVTVKEIESENNLTTTKIKVGQKLKIPAKAEAPNTVVNTPPAAVPAPVAPAPSATPAH